jgi:hypothetical protein
MNFYIFFNAMVIAVKQLQIQVTTIACPERSRTGTSSLVKAIVTQNLPGWLNPPQFRQNSPLVS